MEREAADFAGWDALLRSRVRSNQPWLIVPSDEVGTAHELVSYATLDQQAGRFAAALHARGIGPGERVVVLADNRAPSSLFILAALAARVVVVPFAPPLLGQAHARWRQALERVIADCDPRLLVAPPSMLPLLRNLPGLGKLGVDVVCVVDLSSARITSARISAPSPDDVAIVQYTSGTTSEPRGVVLTHGNLLHNIVSIGCAIDAREAEVGVSWLPMFHDMGLVGSLLLSTYWGMSLVLMRPTSFFLRPSSWLRTISRYRAACSAAPNFAYQLCAAQSPSKDPSDLDLRSWRVAFNGADLIHAGTLSAFSDRFARYGFRREAMFPVYGLAENTLAATLPELGQVPSVDWVDSSLLATRGHAHPCADRARARGVVCVGKTLPGQALRVVDEETRAPLGERRIGEVQLRGPSTSRGEFAPSGVRPRDDRSDGWLCTGDRGYLVHGELYPVGRIKHVAKHLGRSVDCGFVENLVRSAGLARGGAVAVFGSYDPERGSERLVIMAEATPRDAGARQQLCTQIAAVVREALAFGPDEVLAVPPGSIPRTRSGKTQHSAACRLYEEKQHVSTRA